MDTYKSNLGEYIIHKDIKNIGDKEFPSADIVIASVPVQEIMSRYISDRYIRRSEELKYFEIKRAIDVIKPKVFMLECVVGSVPTVGKRLLRESIIEDLNSSGYNVYENLYHFTDYGVPQYGKKLIIYGIRYDIDKEKGIKIPLKVHENINILNAEYVIDDLWYKLDEDIPNHTTKDCSIVKSKLDLNLNRSIKLIQADKISPRISNGNKYIHYRTKEDEKRALSVREYARLCTFPDEFEFKGSRLNTYKQVTNSTPPVLAWHIAKSIYTLLEYK